MDVKQRVRPTIWTAIGVVAVVTVALVLLRACAEDDPAGEPAPAPDDAGQSAAQPEPAGDGTGDGIGDYFEALREVRQLLQGSPDNLPARAAALVDAADPEAIFAFVRDEIALVPTRDGSFQDLVTHVRWGERGALRAGQGTVREKADLLAWLLADAGFDTEVVEASPAGEIEGPLWEAFFRTVEREVDMRLGPGKAEELAGRLTAADPSDATALPERPQEPDLDAWLSQQADALADELLELQGEPDPSRPYTVRGSRLPLVRVVLDGDGRYLNPAFVDAGFDGVEVTSTWPAPDASGLLEVEADLQVLSSSMDPRWTSVAQAHWTADELVGRQLLVGSTATPDPSMAALMRIGDLDVVMPYLVVKGSDLDPATSADLSVMGDPVSVAGPAVTFDETEGTLRRGSAIVEVSEAADASQVAEVTVVADGTSYPQVDLGVSLLDADGAHLAGFGAANLLIEDEGEPVGGRLLHNVGDRPRVLFLLDTSGSIPEEFRGEPMVDFATEVGEDILAAFPDAELGIVRVDERLRRHQLTAGEVWTSDLQQLRERGADAISRNGGSALWENLADATRYDPTVIVFVNDGEDTSDDADTYREQVRLGPPVLVVGVGPVEEDVLQDMADRSGGEYLTAMTADEVRDPLLHHMERSAAMPYRLRYLASEAGAASGEREVTVSVVGSERSGNATYEVPEVPALGAPPVLAGLRLDLTVGSVSVSRVLAGTGDERTARMPDQHRHDDVLSTLLSPTTVHFEGDAPPLSVWLDDHVQARLSQEPFVTRAVARDVEGALEAMDGGFDHLPAAAFAANGPLPGALSGDARTFVQGMRVSILRERVDMESGLKRTSFDILPTARFATMQREHVDGQTDGASDYEVTLRRTAWLAMTEAASFSALGEPATEGVRGHSTWNLLRGAPLEHGGPSGTPQARNVFTEEVTPAERAAWDPLLGSWNRDWHLFVPTDKEPVAMWVAHRTTGELYGILPDGTGGGDVHQRIAETLNDLQRVYRLMALYTMPLNLSPAIGIVALYNVRLAQIYGAATVAIAMMDVTRLEDDIAAALAGLACDTLQTMAFLPFKMAADVITVIDGLLAIGSDHSVPTPCSLAGY